MCGHVGIAGDLAFKDEALMKRLFVMDYFRGPDSTGFAAVRNANNEIKMAKMPMNPIDFFDYKPFSEALNGTISKVFIGHNRSATKGAVNKLNAHPFESGNIVGCHNGTLTEASWSKLKELLGEVTGTDSEAIIKCIDRFGIEETIKHLQGAWALVWYDRSADKLYFLRNEERTFYYSYTADLRKIIWGSEHVIMQAALRMQGSGPYELYKDEEGYSFFPTEVNKLYTFHVSDDLKLNYTKDKPDPESKEFYKGKPKEVAPAKVEDPFDRTTRTTIGSRTGAGGMADQANSINVIGDNKEPFGEWFGRGRFDELAAKGCSWCEGPITERDLGVVIYDKQDTILCPTCSGKLNHNKLVVSKEDFKLIKECKTHA